MKATVLDGVPDFPGLVSMSVYEKNILNILLIYCKAMKWVQKTRGVYDPKTEMVCDTHFLCLNVNDS